MENTEPPLLRHPESRNGCAITCTASEWPGKPGYTPPRPGSARKCPSGTENAQKALCSAEAEPAAPPTLFPTPRQQYPTTATRGQGFRIQIVSRSQLLLLKLNRYCIKSILCDFQVNRSALWHAPFHFVLGQLFLEVEASYYSKRCRCS